MIFFLTIPFFFQLEPSPVQMTKRHSGFSSEKYANSDSGQTKSQNVRVVFWNLENLYDPYDDTTTLDNEFTPTGSRHWTYSKFLVKLNHVAKTLISIGKWEPPVITGLCEVENRYVLNKLIYETPFKRWKFKFIHHESPDARGIDVALLYRPEKFHLLTSKTISIRFPFDSVSQTREILIVSGTVFHDDTITLLVNHWPSRRGGYMQSQPRRDYVAGILKRLVDSIQRINPYSNVLIMGDFNDEPDQESIRTILGAIADTSKGVPGSLINLMLPKINREGTIKFQGRWSIIDQFIVSETMIRGENGLQCDEGDISIYKAGFLLLEDTRFFGSKPNRTYIGPRYNGGFSDHLPITLQIWSIGH